MIDDKKLKEIEAKIGKIPQIFKDLKDLSPEMYEMLVDLDNMIWADGALSRKVKKIIAIAVAAALRDTHAVKEQTAGAKKLGVTDEEIEEGLRVSFLLAGMPSYMYGKIAVKDVMKRE
ncbi:MAG TPA: carboxymuconolactone decarboxylase family protein [Halobacteria archaeon]|nr:carboxymuconolactone decarboxylase family protein [Halobacteria archaeon]